MSDDKVKKGMERIAFGMWVIGAGLMVTGLYFAFGAWAAFIAAGAIVFGIGLIIGNASRAS